MTQAATLAQLASSGAITADANGLVGIGTSTPSFQFQVQTAYEWGMALKFSGATTSSRCASLYQRSLGTTASPSTVTNNTIIGGFECGGYNSSTYTLGFNGGASIFAYAAETWTPTSNATFLQFNTNPSGSAGPQERVRINEGGALLIGTTGFGGVGISMVTPGPAGSGYYSTGNSTAFGYHMRFANPNGAVGSISVTASTTAFTTSSDYRLKENIQPMVGALDKISQLKPCTYTWKSDGSDGEGFIAHELQSVIPNAVIGEKDAVDENGEPHYQGVDTSFLVATLTAAIQELKAELDVCKAEIAALKGV